MENYEDSVATGIYQGGNANQLQSDIGIEGEDFLYLGDHIFGDVVSIKKTCNWRTARSQPTKRGNGRDQKIIHPPKRNKSIDGRKN